MTEKRNKIIKIIS